MSYGFRLGSYISDTVGSIHHLYSIPGTTSSVYNTMHSTGANFQVAASKVFWITLVQWRSSAAAGSMHLGYSTNVASATTSLASPITTTGYYVATTADTHYSITLAVPSTAGSYPFTWQNSANHWFNIEGVEL